MIDDDDHVISSLKVDRSAGIRGNKKNKEN